MTVRRECVGEISKLLVMAGDIEMFIVDCQNNLNLKNDRIAMARIDRARSRIDDLDEALSHARKNIRDIDG